MSLTISLMMMTHFTLKKVSETADMRPLLMSVKNITVSIASKIILMASYSTKKDNVPIASILVTVTPA